MKKILKSKKLFILLAFIYTLSFVKAQNDTMYIMKDGAIIGMYNVSTQLDSIVFYKPETGSIVYGNGVTDINGNIYPTVFIGTQEWMAKNLAVTKYNDNISIPNITDNTEWSNLTTPAYCYYNNTSNADTINTYGALYNWYTVETNKLCPTGWHVPSDAEWTTLTDYLGRFIAGGKLKEAGLDHWNSPNTAATNETGFTALPGGYRFYGDYDAIGFFGYWWSATGRSTSYAWSRDMFYSDGSSVGRGDYDKNNGFSVRCIRD